MKKKILALVVLASALASCVHGHAFMARPKPRNVISRERNQQYCPHCFNAGGTGNVASNTPGSGKWPYPETKASVSRAGLCGDAAGDDFHLKGGKFYNGGEIQETYTAGSIIEIEIGVTAHHNGHFEFFLCDSDDLTLECLQKHQLQRAFPEPSETGSPYDPAYPGRYFLEPKCSMKSVNYGFIEALQTKMKFRLPAGVTCDRCVLQMYWVTANTCLAPGYRNVNWPTTHSECSGDGGSTGWWASQLGGCENSYPEEFWNCADIKIVGGTPTQEPATRKPTLRPTAEPTLRGATPTPKPTQKQTPKPTSEPGTCAELWKQCSGQHHAGPTCCVEGTTCEVQSQWYGQCVPGESSPTPPPTVKSGTPPPTAPLPGAVDNTGFATAHGKLSLDGVHLVDESGERVQLMGMSSHGLQWFDDCYTKESISFLVKNWGINLFRAAMYIGENGYATDRSLADKVDEIVDWCEELGIYVMIDWHVLTPGDPNAWLDSEGASTGLAIDYWKTVAEKYKNKKHVLYETANEPNGVSWETVKKYHDAVIPAIRAIDPETIIIAGTPTWSQDIHLAAANPVADPYNVMYAFHFYAGTHESLMSRVKENAPKIPIFATEWGTSEASGNNGPFLDVAKKFLDVFKGESTGVKISWAQWSYADKSETSAALLPNACYFKKWDDVSESGEFLRDYIKGNVDVVAKSPTSKPTSKPTQKGETKSPTQAPSKRPTVDPTPKPTRKGETRPPTRNEGGGNGAASSAPSIAIAVLCAAIVSYFI